MRVMAPSCKSVARPMALKCDGYHDFSCLRARAGPSSARWGRGQNRYRILGQFNPGLNYGLAKPKSALSFNYCKSSHE